MFCCEHVCQSWPLLCVGTVIPLVRLPITWTMAVASWLTQTVWRVIHSSSLMTVIVNPAGLPALPGTHHPTSCLRPLPSDCSLCLDHSSAWLVTLATQVFAHMSSPQRDCLQPYQCRTPFPAPFPCSTYLGVIVNICLSCLLNSKRLDEGVMLSCLPLQQLQSSEPGMVSGTKQVLSTSQLYA